MQNLTMNKVIISIVFMMIAHTAQASNSVNGMSWDLSHMELIIHIIDVQEGIILEDTKDTIKYGTIVYGSSAIVRISLVDGKSSNITVHFADRLTNTTIKLYKKIHEEINKQFKNQLAYSSVVRGVEVNMQLSDIGSQNVINYLINNGLLVIVSLFNNVDGTYGVISNFAKGGLMLDFYAPGKL